MVCDGEEEQSQVGCSLPLSTELSELLTEVNP